MIIGVPKEIKEQEQRVALLPSAASQLTRRGHSVVVEKNAGIGSGYPDEEYVKAGAEIVDQAKEVFARADMIVKVKEPLEAEFPLLRKGQILFTYLHLAASKSLTEALLKSGVTAVAYETIQVDHRLPLLEPMSEIAGRMSVVMGANFLAKYNGGSGVLLGGVPGVLPGRVVVVGGGTSGVNARAWQQASVRKSRFSMLMSNGCVFSISRWKILHTLYSSEANLHDLMPDCDLLIGAVLLPGAKAPKLITRADVAKNEAGQRARGYFDRSRRLRGNVATHYAPRSSLCGGRRHALLRGKHAGSLCAHRDSSAYKCHLSLRGIACRSRS